MSAIFAEAATWIATVAVVYVVLLTTYVVTCLVVERMSRPLVTAKIQARTTTSELIQRDRKQSIVSLAAIAVMFATGHRLYADFGVGWQPAQSWWGFALSLLASMLLFDTWFYWLHRLIHGRWVYRWVHRWHHLTVTPVTWSNNSDRLIDNLFLQSYWLVAHLVLPVSPLALVIHKLYDQITGVAGHSGYEHGGIWCWPPSPLVGVTHHDQHHRYFLCNYATHFTLWDRLMGTLHPEHDAELKRNILATTAAKRGVAVPAE